MLWERRSLVYQMAKREAALQHRGMLLGSFWLVLMPLILLGTYTLIFSLLFDIGDSATRGGQVSYPLLVFSGMTVFGFYSECLTRPPGYIRNNVIYVTKLQFPKEILGVVLFCEAFYRTLYQLCILLVFYLLFHDNISWTALYLPVIWFPLCLILLGTIWLYSALGVFVRDIQNLAVSVTTVLMFMSPIFYSVDQIPPEFRPVYLMNPVAAYIEMTRDALFWGQPPQLELYLPHFAFAVAVLWLGQRVFTRLSEHFADVV